VRTTLLAGMMIMFALSVTQDAEAKSYDHPLIEQTYRFRANGDADVEEIRTFRFDGDFTWAQVVRETRGQYGTYRIRFQEVLDADTRQPLRFETSSSAGEQTIKWYYRAQNTTRRFLLRYTIENAIQRYRDAAQFYWQAIEGDHAPIARVKITLVPPRPSPELFKVFVHGRAKPGELDIAGDFSRAVVTQSRIPTASFVEIRALFDQALFPDVPVRGDESYESLLADERQVTSATRRAALTQLLAVAAAAGLVILLIVAYFWTYLKFGREPEVPFAGEYERDPPSELPPAVVPAILTQSSVSQSQMPRAFAATLVECARLGYLEFREIEDKGLLGTGLFKSETLQYTLTEKGQALLAGKPVDRPAGERALEAFEIQVLDVVFTRAGDGTKATGDDIEEWGKRMVGKKSNFLRFVTLWGPDLRRWFVQTHFPLDDPRSERAKKLFIGGASIVGFLFLLMWFGGVHWWIGILAGLVLVVAMPASLAISRRTPEGALEYTRWQAFKKFITDFSAMKDAGPELLPLWEKYLVYATALGVADKLLANLKLVAKEYNSTVPAAAWYYSSSTRADAGTIGAMNLDSLDSLSRSFENFNNLSRALSSSTRSGGGFSGGGGGGGGGGRSSAG
jgi:uncharacterized membrane protein